MRKIKSELWSEIENCIVLHHFWRILYYDKERIEKKIKEEKENCAGNIAGMSFKEERATEERNSLKKNKMNECRDIESLLKFLQLVFTNKMKIFNHTPLSQ